MNLKSWLTTSLQRIYPRTVGGRSSLPALDIALNERCSFQLAVRYESSLLNGEDTEPLNLSVECEAPPGWQVLVRRVGYVSVRHLNTNVRAAEIEGQCEIPGFVPDPLFPENTIKLPVNETHAFWFTVTPAEKVKPGPHAIQVRLKPEKGRTKVHVVKIHVHDVTLKPRAGFSVANLLYIDALMDYYGCQGFDDKFWEILPAYLRNLAEHGQDTVSVPMFTPPLDGVKRPSQLLRVTRCGKDKYSFDWQDVKRYIKLAQAAGLRKFEWTHLFTQWGVSYAIRIYENQGLDEQLLWPADTPATSPTYRSFLQQFLPELHRFLKSEKLLSRSFFHLSDEPHGEAHLENYRQARALLKELAPWMKVMDALSEISFARDRLTDMPVASIRKAMDFVAADIPCWCYYCCNPRGDYLNRLLDTPLTKIRMGGWLFYRWPFQGFLHWGYNYWYKSQTRKMIDPFTVQDGEAWPYWANGDPFIVYPGPAGPLDSIRWEVFAESLQDYALLQTLGIPREGQMLAALKNFQDFPKTAAWLRKRRRELLSGSNHKS